jgi:hypothetical protein
MEGIRRRRGRRRGDPLGVRQRSAEPRRRLCGLRRARGTRRAWVSSPDPRWHDAPEAPRGRAPSARAVPRSRLAPHRAALDRASLRRPGEAHLGLRAARDRCGPPVPTRPRWGATHGQGEPVHHRGAQRPLARSARAQGCPRPLGSPKPRGRHGGGPRPPGAARRRGAHRWCGPGSQRRELPVRHAQPQRGRPFDAFRLSSLAPRTAPRRGRRTARAAPACARTGRRA